MTENIMTGGSQLATDQRSERAQRAIKVFRSMQPGLTGYARAITGNRAVEVVLSEGIPRTNGTKIFYKPPIALGDMTPHQRGKCDRRDRTSKQQLCEACRTREEVLVSIYHEIDHIAFGTFEEVSKEHLIKVLDRALEVSGTKYGKLIKAQWDTIPEWKKRDYLNISSLISPYLPIIVNALEDARVDEAGFKARKGTRVMFDAVMLNIFQNGIVGDDGELVKWIDKPLDSQAMIGLFVKACGYNFTGWFHTEVEEALKDSQLSELVGRIDTARSVEGVYTLAFPILTRLRELGFCKAPEDPDDEPDEEEQTEDDEESE